MFVCLFIFFPADCWQQDPHKRPSFQGILEDLEEISDSSFAQDDQGSFRTLQDGWQTEIDQIFDELRKKEKVAVFVINVSLLVDKKVEIF